MYGVYDDEGTCVLDAVNYNNPQWYTVSNYEEEIEINAIEEKAIENGAIVYTGLTR